MKATEQPFFCCCLLCFQGASNIQAKAENHHFALVLFWIYCFYKKCPWRPGVMGCACICRLYKMALTLDCVDETPRGGRLYFLIWVIWGCATGQGMVFGFSVLNRVYNFMLVYTKQGPVAWLSSFNMAYTVLNIPRSETFAGLLNTLELCKARQCVFCHLS